MPELLPFKPTMFRDLFASGESIPFAYFLMKGEVATESNEFIILKEMTDYAVRTRAHLMPGVVSGQATAVLRMQYQLQSGNRYSLELQPDASNADFGMFKVVSGSTIQLFVEAVNLTTDTAFAIKISGSGTTIKAIRGVANYDDQATFEPSSAASGSNPVTDTAIPSGHPSLNNNRRYQVGTAASGVYHYTTCMIEGTYLEPAV